MLTLLLVVLPAGLYVWGSRSSTFAIDDVVVTGTRRVAERKARDLLEARFVGRNLFAVREDDVEKALSSLLFAAGVRIDRDFPSTLRVEVREHVPAIYALAGKRWYLVSRQGVVLGAVRHETRKPQVAVRKGPQDVVRRLPAVCAGVTHLKRDTRVTDAEVDAALRVLAVLPAGLRSEVASVCRTTAGVRLRLRGGATVDLGPVSRLSAKVTALDAVLSYYAAQEVAATYVDVSVPDRPVARPML